MTVAFIGESNFKWTAATTRKFNRKITKMVEKTGARTFLFTHQGNFDFLCWIIVTKLRSRFRDITRVYVRINDEEADPYNSTALMFDKTFLLTEARDAGIRAEFVRNDMMVDTCDLLVTYFQTKKLKTPRIKGDEETAAEKAQKMKKQVLNLYS